LSAVTTTAAGTVETADSTRLRRNLRRRRFGNRVLWVACAGALALVVTPMVWIVVGITTRALSHWHWGVLTTTSSAPTWGVANAVVGTFLLMAGVLVLTGIVGVAGGVYLAEFAPQRSGSFMRGASEVLAGVPSIVLGYVGYLTLVVALHWGFSLAAAVIVLSVMVVPYVMKSTEISLRQVPTNYREGAEALGMRSGYTLRTLVITPALPGIVTGLIVALAISLGETAPLLYTANFTSHYPTLQLTHSSVPYLTYLVYTFFYYPNARAQNMAHVAALLLILMVIVLIVVIRVIVSMTQRYAPERAQRLGKTPK
jgi:phosphate transport system permease protein